MLGHSPTPTSRSAACSTPSTAAPTATTPSSSSSATTARTSANREHWLKYALWEQTCQVLLSISVPGTPHQKIDSPVGLIDLYPTLIDLCGLETPATHTLDGVDLAPLLAGKVADRGKPVLSTYGRGNHTLRDARYLATATKNFTTTNAPPTNGPTSPSSSRPRTPPRPRGRRRQ